MIIFLAFLTSKCIFGRRFCFPRSLFSCHFLLSHWIKCFIAYTIKFEQTLMIAVNVHVNISTVKIIRAIYLRCVWVQCIFRTPTEANIAEIACTVYTHTCECADRVNAVCCFSSIRAKRAHTFEINFILPRTSLRADKCSFFSLARTMCATLVTWRKKNYLLVNTKNEVNEKMSNKKHS